MAAAFFPATCHAVRRREFLVAASGALAAVAVGAGSTHARGDGSAIIRRFSTVPGDPWAVAHGIRAMGRRFTIAGGRTAVDHLLERALVSVSANRTTVLAFDTAVEAHPDAFLAEALIEPGVPETHRFTHAGRRRTVSDVVAGARARFRPRLTGAEPNALPWSLIALTRTTPAVRGRWTNAWGEAVDLDAVVEHALDLLERASAPVADAMRADRPLAGKAPVHAFTCGGTHMLYALLTAVHAGYDRHDRRKRVQRQVDLMVWRLRADIELIDRFYGPRARSRDAEWYRIDSHLKLLGHAEECLALGVRDVVSLTASQQAQRAAAVERVRQLLDELERRDLNDAKALHPELFRQLVGDTCHARHGLTLA